MKPYCTKDTKLKKKNEDYTFFKLFILTQILQFNFY